MQCYSTIPCMHMQAYTPKRHILIQVLPAPNVYHSEEAKLSHVSYMHEQITKGIGMMNTCINRFGIRIGSRKYLNEHTPLTSVSL